MANGDLKTSTSGSGVQNTTGSPQTSAQANGFSGGQQSGQVQPGTATSLLSNSSGGVQLGGNKVTTVALTSSGKAQSTQPAIEPRHVNPALFGFSIILFLVAVYLFVSASRSSKKQQYE